MCYSLMQNQSQARDDAAQGKSARPAETVKTQTPDALVTARNGAAERRFSELMRSLQRLARRQGRTDEEPVI